MRSPRPTQPTYPQIIGVPGMGLADSASWAVNGTVARIGRDGELHTARVLNTLATPGGPTVLHDLMLPLGSVKANIDHVVVSGRTVTLVDTKVWKPGLVWTLGRRTRRGWSPFPSGDKVTMEIARLAVEALLRNKGVKASVRKPLLMVWPSSSKGSLNVRWYRPVGARAFRAEVVERRLHHLFGADPAEPDVVAALVPLITSVKAAKTRPAPAPRMVADPYLSDDF